MSPIATLRIPSHVRSIIDADGAVLLDVRRGTYYSLNGIGAEVWTRIEAGLSLEQIEQDLARDFEVPADVVAHDVQTFVDRLRDKALVDVTG